MACNLDSTYVPSSTCKPDLADVSSSYSLLDNTPPNNYSYINSDDENPPTPIPPIASTPSTTPQLPQWVHSTQEVIGVIVGDPID